MIDEIVVERRHQIEIADTLGAQSGGARAADVEMRQANERAADQRHREQRANAHGVIERHDAERALAVRVKILRHMRDRGGALGTVPAWYAFRPRGRARGIEHQRPGVGTDARASRRSPWRAMSCAKSKSVPSGRRDRSAMRGSVAAPARAVTALRGNVLIDEGASFGIVDTEIDLVVLGAPIHRRDDDAGELAGPVQRGRLPAYFAATVTR